MRSLHREKGDWRPTRATQEMEEDHTHTLAASLRASTLQFTLYFTENAQKYTPARTSAQAAGSSGARVDDGGLTRDKLIKSCLLPRLSAKKIAYLILAFFFSAGRSRVPVGARGARWASLAGLVPICTSYTLIDLTPKYLALLSLLTPGRHARVAAHRPPSTLSTVRGRGTPRPYGFLYIYCKCKAYD